MHVSFYRLTGWKSAQGHIAPIPCPQTGRAFYVLGDRTKAQGDETRPLHSVILSDMPDPSLIAMIAERE